MTEEQKEYLNELDVHNLATIYTMIQLTPTKINEYYKANPEHIKKIYEGAVIMYKESLKKED